MSLLGKRFAYKRKRILFPKDFLLWIWSRGMIVRCGEYGSYNKEIEQSLSLMPLLDNLSAVTTVVE